MKVNRRVAMTKRLLQDALLRLLAQKELDKINVSELCREADINRATFYKHYIAIRDVLVEIEINLMEEFSAHVSPPTTMQQVREYLVQICRYLYDHAEVIRVLIGNDTDDELCGAIGQINDGLIELRTAGWAMQNTADDDSLKLVATFLGSGCYFLMRTWLMEKIDKTPEEVADIVYRILCREYSD